MLLSNYCIDQKQVPINEYFLKKIYQTKKKKANYGKSLYSEVEMLNSHKKCLDCQQTWKHLDLHMRLPCHYVVGGMHLPHEKNQLTHES